MGLLFFFILLCLLLTVLFVSGIVKLIKGRQHKNKAATKKGILLIAIPLVVLTAFYINQNGFNFSKKTTATDLAGVYHISDAGSLLPAVEYKKYRLEFKNDGRFYFSAPALIPVCYKGKFFVEDNDIDQVSFYCDSTVYKAGISKKRPVYEIEFLTDDQHGNQKIIFSKDK